MDFLLEAIHRSNLRSPFKQIVVTINHMIVGKLAKTDNSQLFLQL